MENNEELRKEVAEAIYKELIEAEYRLEGTYAVYVSVKNGKVIISNAASNDNYCVVSFSSKDESFTAIFSLFSVFLNEEIEEFIFSIFASKALIVVSCLLISFKLLSVSINFSEPIVYVLRAFTRFE